MGVGCRVEGDKGEKWENCNSIINKIHFKKEFSYKCYLYFIKTLNNYRNVYRKSEEIG